MAIAFIAPLHLLAGLQLRQALATGHVDDADAARRLRLLAGLMVSAVACTAAAVWQRDPSFVCLVALLACARGAEGQAEVLAGLPQRQHRLDAVGRAQVTRAVLQVLGAWAGLASPLPPLPAAAAGVLLADLVVLLLIERRWARTYPAPTGTGGSPWPMLQATLPLGAVLGLGALGAQLPRFWLEHGFGVEELGRFAAAAAMVAAGIQAGCSHLPALGVRLAQQRDGPARRRLLIRAVLAAAVLGAAGLALAAALGSTLLAVAYGEAFRTAAAALLACSVYGAAEMLSAPAGTALTAAGRWRAQLLPAASAVVVTAIACAVLVPQGGAVGAGIALAIGVCTRGIWSWLLVARPPRLAPAGTAPIVQDG